MSHKIKAVIIIGSSAVGKMTVAEEIAKKTGFNLFHNHMAIEPVLDVFGYYNKKVVGKFRELVFKELSCKHVPGVVTTFMLNFESDDDTYYIEHIIEVMNRHSYVEPYIVELVADADVRRKRNTSKHRLDQKPSKRDLRQSSVLFEMYEQSGRYESLPGELDYEHYIKIDNTKLSAESVAEQVCRTFNLN